MADLHREYIPEETSDSNVGNEVEKKKKKSKKKSENSKISTIQTKNIQKKNLQEKNSTKKEKKKIQKKNTKIIITPKQENNISKYKTINFKKNKIHKEIDKDYIINDLLNI